MAQLLKIAVLRTSDCTDTTLQSVLNEIEGLRVVAELSLADDLEGALNQTRPDVLVILLGNAPAHLLLGQIGDLVKSNGDLSVILAGPKRDPDLLLTAMRAGIREFAELPIKPEQLLEMLQGIIAVKPVRHMGRCIVLHGAGGGCGTSTVACNLAVEIARSGRGKVALVDLDLHMGQLAAMLDLPPTHNLIDLCTIENDDIEPGVLNNVMLTHSSGLRLIARPRELVGEDVPLLSRTVNVLHHILELYDYVIVDLDMKQDVTEGKIIQMADEFVLIVQPVINAVRNASQLIKTLNNEDYHPGRLRLVLNRVPKKLGLLRKDNIEKNLNAPVFWEIPEDYDVVTSAVNMGLPLCEHAASSKSRSAIRDLAMAITSPSAAQVIGDTGKDGFFKKFFQKNPALSVEKG